MIPGTHWTKEGYSRFSENLRLAMNILKSRRAGTDVNPRDVDGKPLRPVNGVDIPRGRRSFNVVGELRELKDSGSGVIYSDAPNPPSGESVE